MTIEVLETLFNRLLPDLQIFVRDANLPAQCASKYVPGMVIREKAFTDASSRVMGMVTTHRYNILSNHMADLSEYEHETNWGLCVANANSYFKVIDVFEQNGKTLITLLHLFDDDWKLFEQLKIVINGTDLVKMSRQRFLDKYQQPPVPELTTKKWLERCSFPIGMSDDGVFWEL
jgi:hypothetical protein